jgi:hypothetical protein
VARHLFLGTIRSDYKSIRRDLATALNPAPENIVGPTPLWDAIGLVVAELRNGPEPRAILLVTDGRSTGNHLSLAEAAARALDGKVAVNIVYVGPPPQGAVMPQDDVNAIIVRPSAPLAGWSATPAARHARQLRVAH